MKSILQVCAFGAPNPGNFMASLIQLQGKMQEEGYETIYAFPEKARGKEWCRNLAKTNKVYIVGNNSRALNITKRVAGGAAAGLLLSGISMLFGADPTKALIYGMSIGAGSGAISAISSHGEGIQLIEGSQHQIMLTEPLTVQTYRQEGY